MSAKHYLGAETLRLDGGWSLLVCEPDAYALPSALPAEAGSIPALVPGTAASALQAAGLFDRDAPVPLIDKDIWYERSLSDETPGPAILRLEGLATIAEIFLDDALILSSDSMFEAHDIPVALTGSGTLSICFRALKPHLERSGPRARWRPRLMNNQGIRLIRMTALGFMPGWAPEIQAGGPWRPITLIRPRKHTLCDLSLSAHLEGGTGRLAVRFAYEGSASSLRLACGGIEAGFSASDGIHSAELRLPDVKPWWPHTHGAPDLYEVTLRVDGEDFPLARTGFRSLSVDRGADGNDFAVIVNGEKIFCRGAVWTSADIAGLPGDRADYKPWLELAKDAGMNMIRVPGIGVYESPDFFALCDELGIMVWQDFMFANFDYPVADPGFVIHVKSEVAQFLQKTQVSPSLAILCGGSEIYQQGAMLGLPEGIWKGPLCEELLRGLAQEHRPDLPYVANSPSGGHLPFYPNAGVAHYYGVGGYMRSLDDARRANIRFAAECLAFSNLSDADTLAGGKASIPRDPGADWDFEDVRDHYLRELYGVDPSHLRNTDFKRYLALSRAVTGEVMEATFAEWRRPGSTCNGALTFTFQDVMPGPGWGVVDVDGRPKPAWYALKRAFRPLQVVLADEGTNGLDIHLLNETSEAVPVRLELVCLRQGRMPVVSGQRDLVLAPRSSESIASVELFGAFFDTNYAYRFGPPSHDVTVARLMSADGGSILAEAFHFPLGRTQATHDPNIRVMRRESEDGTWLELSTDVFAQSVSIDCPGYRPSDNSFHLAPGITKMICLAPLTGTPPRPAGSIRAIGSKQPAAF
ncbi:glycoside hydrolase family 2 protein [Neorhizobium lilium]|uniref:beta-mannosidase n=1 Tax=Neorhizobium lilium TaxID=2503024 RepID=A0A3S3STL1_9HYPH|nr:glycoside hydrolase family 2 protein [Neorhizobium lilium]RWX74491.1 glycoside hydrolase family 2 protein [Neorhizobium lilium]